MKIDKNEVNKKAKELVNAAKKKGVIKPHTDAFKEFPVENEIHKGRKEFFN